MNQKPVNMSEMFTDMYFAVRQGVTFVEAKEILSLLIHECKLAFSFMFTPFKCICKSMYLKLSTFVLLCFVLKPQNHTMQQHIQFPA